MKRGAGIKHDMYQRNNTPAVSMPTILPMYLSMPERCPPGQKTTGSVPGTSPFLFGKPAQEPETRKTGAAATNAEARAAGSRHQHPAPGRTKGHKTRAQTHGRTTNGRTHRKDDRPDNQETFPPVVVPLPWCFLLPGQRTGGISAPHDQENLFSFSVVVLNGSRVVALSGRDAGDASASQCAIAAALSGGTSTALGISPDARSLP